MQNADVLKASLDALGRDGVAFAEDVLADLKASHSREAAAVRFASGAELWSALQRFVMQSAAAKSGAAPDATLVAFADSLMKVFAKRLGRVKWTPGMALAWNAALREHGVALLGS